LTLHCLPLSAALPFGLPPSSLCFFATSFGILFFCFFFPFFLFACVASWLDIDLAIVVHCHCLYVCKMEYVEIEKKMGRKCFAGRMRSVSQLRGILDVAALQVLLTLGMEVCFSS
jgi:hypothetical protein